MRRAEVEDEAGAVAVAVTVVTVPGTSGEAVLVAATTKVTRPSLATTVATSPRKPAVAEEEAEGVEGLEADLADVDSEADFAALSAGVPAARVSVVVAPSVDPVEDSADAVAVVAARVAEPRAGRAAPRLEHHPTSLLKATVDPSTSLLDRNLIYCI